MNVLLETFPPPRPRWSTKKMPDRTGKVFLVTGGNAGLGYETVKELLKKGGKVYMAARSRSKAEQAIEALEKETSKRAVFLELDVGDLASVKRAAEEFKRQESQLNVLFNNAGVMMAPPELFTPAGYDLQFGTNVLGHFYLIKLLLPTLLATADANPDKPRIINTSSLAHRFFPQIDFELLHQDSPKRQEFKSLSSSKLYRQSKFGNIVLSNELARRYGDKIVSLALHPGNVATTSVQNDPGLAAKVAGWLLAEPWKGAITQLYAGMAPEAAELGGQYLVPYARVGKANANANKVETGMELWEWLEAQVKDI
ncbi:NAD(P)-binding protein [Exidia glandulosa HHB12029]|uniref:NAD(P)-binding protein n=1 Tax=Exidia glandulosa HHB12029 TaxID=1314781 RepID=A0A165EG30_EXIGL|nr:NAD(P)-binding protein [Exidia glandulosa HHB12029]